MSKIKSHDDDTLATLVEAPTTSPRVPPYRLAHRRRRSARRLRTKEAARADTAAAKAAATPATATPAVHSAQTGGTMGAHDTAKPAAGAMSAADAMDAMHGRGSRRSPRRPPGRATVLLAAALVDGVKVYELTAQRDPVGGRARDRRVEALAYNGQVPGPQIRVREGDRVRVVVKNELPSRPPSTSTASSCPNDQDGVPFITQPPIKPGASVHVRVHGARTPARTCTTRTTTRPSRSASGCWARSSWSRSTPRAIERVDVDYMMILNDGAHGYTLNGKGFPATEPIVAKLGQKVRIRFMNEGMMIHPMHLHGMHMTVIDKDGWAQPAPWKCDTLNIAPGERWDVIVNCNNPGTWAFHCHILPARRVASTACSAW